MPRWASAVLVVAFLLVLTIGFFELRTIRPATPVSATAIRCHSDGLLPDARCTPGVTDPRVTQDNLQSTICAAGYTKGVRPSSAYTDALKVQQIKEYAYADRDPADYEEDHLIPLELGGAPSDPRNLWPEPKADATKKDSLENALHARVCTGTLTLAAAQSAIASNWQTAA
jgi:hypothetical protein